MKAEGGGMKANGDLPEGWEVVTIGEVIEDTEARNPVTSPEKDFVYVDIGSVDNAVGAIRNPKRLLGREAPSRARKVIRTNDVIFATTRPYLKGIALVPAEFDNQICSTGFAVLRAKRDEIEPRWLFYLCRSELVMDQVLVNMRGGTYPAVSDKDVRAAEIPLPPLPEQRRIVARVEEFARRAEEARGLRREAVKWVEAILPSVRAQVFSELKAQKTLFFTVVIDARNGFGRRPKAIEQGPIVLRLADVAKGHIDLSNPRRVGMTGKELAQYRVQDGDLLFVRVNGSISLVGRCILGEVGSAEVAYNDHLIRVRVNKEQIAPRYAAAFLNLPTTRALIESRAVTTAGQHSISQPSILTLPIKLPPLSEQRRIVAYLDGLQAKAEAIRAAQAETERELEALMPSVLARAMRGEW